MPLPNGDTAVFASRLAQRVDLRRNFGDVPTGISGIYRCDIPIMEDNPVTKSVFVGLYSHKRGNTIHVVLTCDCESHKRLRTVCGCVMLPKMPCDAKNAL